MNLFSIIEQKFQKLRQNYHLLQQELEKVGQAYEKKSYEELLKPAEEISLVKTVNGDQLSFAGEAYDLKPDGTLCFCIDVDGLPTLLGVKPSYHFYKRSDGSVYY